MKIGVQEHQMLALPDVKKQKNDLVRLPSKKLLKTDLISGVK